MQWPSSDHEAVRGAVRDWWISALGDRPGDHLVRDVLLGSTLRDGRTQWFHRLTTEPEPWMRQRVAHLNGGRRAQALQLTALDFLHRRQLGKLWEREEDIHGEPAPSRFEAGRSFGLLNTLSQCRPVGAYLEWRGMDVRDHDFTCGYARACPWCHARAVGALHERLIDGPCNPAQLAGRHLIRLRLRLSSHLLARQWEFTKFAQQEGYDVARRAWIRGGQLHLPALEVKLVRRYFGSWLKRVVKPWRPEGGLISHQVGPRLDTAGDGDGPNVLDYEHEVTLIAEVAFAGPESIEGFRRAMGLVGGYYPHVAYGSEMPWALSIVSRVEVIVVAADHRQALRRLLAGQPYRASSARVGVETSRAHARGLDGALRLMPWSLANPVQWWAHVAATHRAKLFAPFGTWAEQMRLARSGPRAGDRRRERAFAAHNHQNRRAAEQRRAGLLEVGREVYEELARRPGRRPGRPALRAAMAEAGHPISDKVAKDLLPMLRERVEDRA